MLLYLNSPTTVDGQTDIVEPSIQNIPLKLKWKFKFLGDLYWFWSTQQLMWLRSR